MLSASQKARALRLYDLGVPPSKIGDEFGITSAAICNIVRRANHPSHAAANRKKRAEHRAEERAELKEMRALALAAEISRYSSGGTAVEKDARRLMELIPYDTRSLTGVMLGDPLPGRSALDKKRVPIEETRKRAA